MTDKKIGRLIKMSEENLCDFSHEEGVLLIDQLKKCREENVLLQSKFLIEEKAHVQSVNEYWKLEQRTKDACFEAGWAWIQDDFGEQFGYDPTDDTDKEDFKQVIEKAKVEQHLECI